VVIERFKTNHICFQHLFQNIFNVFRRTLQIIGDDEKYNLFLKAQIQFYSYSRDMWASILDFCIQLSNRVVKKGKNKAILVTGRGGL
jgi:hypothetical protein